ncbi:uncharacterized protein CDV56_105770 [Aspergillus thermomutatus]|uniref:Uncharacterized protein n=1 Tax=Aspergillus thermomutatus TaxID=41047 RepID=A0A397HAF2_ASPTH|nr:uncharacterized protein CDV56_105770 [Aspergillus thermomutatus]RHZ60105.1 hypothetical protein CDV56_105770 [Aspergillus thermomutatus]
MYPVSSTRFIDLPWDFAQGWNYVRPLELTVAGLTNNYCQVDGYEEEFWTSVLKPGAIVVFMIIALILVAAEALNEASTVGIGEREPGTDLVHFATASGASALCSSPLPSRLAEPDWSDSRPPSPESIQVSTGHYFYVLGLTFVGLFIRSYGKRLLGADTLIDANVSPFVLIALNTGLWSAWKYRGCTPRLVLILAGTRSTGMLSELRGNDWRLCRPGLGCCICPSSSREISGPLCVPPIDYLWRDRSKVGDALLFRVS